MSRFARHAVAAHRTLRRPAVATGNGLADAPGRRRRDGRGRLGPPDDVGPPARHRGSLGAAVVRRLERALRLGRADPAGRARAARRREHVPQPGPDREARRHARPPVRRPRRPRPRRRLVRARARRARHRFRPDGGRATGPSRRGVDCHPAPGSTGSGSTSRVAITSSTTRTRRPARSAATCRSSSAARGRRRRCGSWPRMRTRGIRPATSMW